MRYWQTPRRGQYMMREANKLSKRVWEDQVGVSSLMGNLLSFSLLVNLISE